MDFPAYQWIARRMHVKAAVIRGLKNAMVEFMKQEGHAKADNGFTGALTKAAHEGVVRKGRNSLLLTTGQKQRKTIMDIMNMPRGEDGETVHDELAIYDDPMKGMEHLTNKVVGTLESLEQA